MFIYGLPKWIPKSFCIHPIHEGSKMCLCMVSTLKWKWLLWAFQLPLCNKYDPLPVLFCDSPQQKGTVGHGMNKDINRFNNWKEQANGRKEWQLWCVKLHCCIQSIGCHFWSVKLCLLCDNCLLLMRWFTYVGGQVWRCCGREAFETSPSEGAKLVMICQYQVNLDTEHLSVDLFAWMGEPFIL